MRYRAVVKECVPPAALRLIRGLRTEDPYRAYLSARAPWTPGYHLHKMEVVAGTLGNPGLLARFRRGADLPPGFGVGIDERCIEYPWLFAHLHAGPERLLDAGSVLNYPQLLGQPHLAGKTVHLLTLAPERGCLSESGVSYLFGDLRDLPIRDGYYDTIACISTLEHVGLDNSGHTGDERWRERKPQDYLRAARELRRVLRPGGTLLLSVPFGVYRDFGVFQQFDRVRLDRLVGALGGGTAVQTRFYRYTRSGWNVATAEECATAEFVDWITRPPQPRTVPVPIEPDLAVAARAVACLRMVKPPAA